MAATSHQVESPKGGKAKVVCMIQRSKHICKKLKVWVSMVMRGGSERNPL